MQDNTITLHDMASKDWTWQYKTVNDITIPDRNIQAVAGLLRTDYNKNAAFRANAELSSHYS